MCFASYARRQASTDYFETQRRYNYVTPKSYLELIGFYKFLLDQKRTEVQRQIDRLDVGLSTLRKTAADVAELQVDLTHTMVKVRSRLPPARHTERILKHCEISWIVEAGRIIRFDMYPVFFSLISEGFVLRTYRILLLTLFMLYSMRFMDHTLNAFSGGREESGDRGAS